VAADAARSGIEVSSASTKLVLRFFTPWIGGNPVLPTRGVAEGAAVTDRGSAPWAPRGSAAGSAERGARRGGNFGAQAIDLGSPRGSPCDRALFCSAAGRLPCLR